MIDRRQFLKFSSQAFAGMALASREKIWSKTENSSDVSLDQKIGQMLMVGFRGFHVDKTHPIAKDIIFRHIGAVVLFDYDVPARSPERNIQSPFQLKSLVESLQHLSPTPLLIAIDYEGGRVTRLKKKFGFPTTLSAQSLGEKNDLTLTRSQTQKMAELLAKMGVNLNLAPVVDLNLNPENPIIGKLERSFSSDAKIVTHHALEFIKGHHENNILCTLKHFPGHGSSKDDSHKGMVDISKSWSMTELIPYRNIIERELADSIMTAHVFNKNLDSEVPATLSKPIITGLLRGKMNYDGVIISDDMQMGAISKEYGLEMAIEKAIEAGVDILSFANNSVFEENIAVQAIEIIQKLIQNGKIEISRIDRSYKRILRLKSRSFPHREGINKRGH